MTCKEMADALDALLNQWDETVQERDDERSDLYFSLGDALEALRDKFRNVAE